MLMTGQIGQRQYSHTSKRHDNLARADDTQEATGQEFVGR